MICGSDAPAAATLDARRAHPFVVSLANHERHEIMSSTTPATPHKLPQSRIGRLPSNLLRSPYFAVRRECFGVIERRGGDIQMIGPSLRSIRQRCATRVAETAQRGRRRTKLRHGATQKFDVLAAEDRPRQRWSAAREATTAAVTQRFCDRITVHAVANRAAQAAAFVHAGVCVAHDDAHSRGSSAARRANRRGTRHVQPSVMPAAAIRIALAPTNCHACKRWPNANASTAIATIG